MRALIISYICTALSFASQFLADLGNRNIYEPYPVLTGKLAKLFQFIYGPSKVEFGVTSNMGVYLNEERLVVIFLVVALCLSMAAVACGIIVRKSIELKVFSAGAIIFGGGAFICASHYWYTTGVGL